MKTCPHCQFLVSDGATTCSVCHQDVTAPPVPAAIGAPFAAAPGEPGAPGAPGTPPPGTFAPGGIAPDGVGPTPGWGPDGAPTVTATTKQRMGRGRVALIVVASTVAVMVGLAVVSIGVVSVLGRTSEVAADDVMWRAYVDPAGRFQIDLPGEPTSDTVEVAAGAGTIDVEALNVPNSAFVASVGLNKSVVTDGMTFAEIPFSPEGAARGVESTGFDDAEVVQHAVIEGSDDTAMGLVIHGTVDGEPAVMLTRVVVVGPDLYEIAVAGPRDQRDELAKIHDRMTASFTAPAPA